MREKKKTGVDKAEFLSSLRKKVRETGSRFTYKIRELGLRLADAFSGQEVKSFAVDFGAFYRAVILQVELHDGRMFCLRSETGSRTGVVNISVLRGGKLLFTGVDRIDTLKDNLESLFKEEVREEDLKDEAGTQEKSPKDEWRKKALSVKALLEMLEKTTHLDEEILLALSDDIGDIAKVRDVGQQCTGDGETFYVLFWKTDKKPLPAGGVLFSVCWSLSHHEFKDDTLVIVRDGVRYGNSHYVTGVTDNGVAAIIRCGKIGG